MGRSHILLSAVLIFLTALPLRPQAVAPLQTVNLGQSELSDAIRLYAQEELSLRRQFEFDFLPAYRREQLRLCQAWQKALETTDFAPLSADGRVDYTLFAAYLKQKRNLLDDADKRFADLFGRFPFIAAIASLTENRRQMKWDDPQTAATALSQADAQLNALERDGATRDRWALYADQVEAALDDWYRFYHLYSPVFDFWVEMPYNKLKQSFKRMRSQANGNAAPGLDGLRAGERGLRDALDAELIPYSARELIDIGRKELDWCLAEMKKVAAQLGYRQDWREVFEHVKRRALPPGEYPEAIRRMAGDAVAFLERHDLLTIPNMAKNDWHIDMLSAREQLMNPFFSGGDVIALSYPTSDMDHQRKMMSMRGNNPHFGWATVHHELIPGHHLQFYMAARYNSHRRLFDTPFYVEGWPLYWEMKLWDMDFARCPEDRVGMLFWRMHRCARIVFSLSYHLGLMSSAQCVDMLVDTVGHEPENARAEVRRSFAGNDPPLYQCAYLLGGLQLRALAREAVDSGRMDLKQFHDAVLRENSMPIALLRAKLLGLPIERPFRNDWRFYGQDQSR